MLPDTFWKNSMKENTLLAEYHTSKDEDNWIRSRNVEFAIYNTTFAGMSGARVFKKIKEPQDLYKLPSDKPKEVMEGKRAEDYMKTLVKPQ